MEHFQVPAPDISFNEMTILKANQLYDRVYSGIDGYQFSQGYKESEFDSKVESLKSDIPLGKKRWYQRATGIVVGFAANKGAETVFEETLKPMLKDLIHYHHFIDKLIS